MPLGPGELVPAHVPNPVAQVEYLRAVSRCVPAVVTDLVSFDPADDERLRAWAEQYGFTDAWALSVARRSAWFWRECPEAVGIWRAPIAVRWEPPYVAPPPRPGEVERPPWMMAAPAWNPMNETEASFRARVEAYIDALKSAPGVKRTDAKALDTPHFEWLARHHAGRWTYEEISAKYQSDEMKLTTISDAVGRLATLVGLTLRPGPGRTV